MAIASRCDRCLTNFGEQSQTQTILDPVSKDEYCPSCYGTLPLSHRAHAGFLRTCSRLRTRISRGKEWLTGWGWLVGRPAKSSRARQGTGAAPTRLLVAVCLLLAAATADAAAGAAGVLLRSEMAPVTAVRVFVRPTSSANNHDSELAYNTTSALGQIIAPISEFDPLIPHRFTAVRETWRVPGFWGEKTETRYFVEDGNLRWTGRVVER